MMPPWPGIIFPKSFIPVFLFIYDATKSPICERIAPNAEKITIKLVFKSNTAK